MPANIHTVLNLIAENDLPAALIESSGLLATDPQNAELQHLQGLVYSKLGDFDFAKQHLHEALRINPNYAVCYNTLGSIYYRQGQIKSAIPIFEKAIRLNPQSWEAHYNLANCFIKIEMVLQAIQHYETVLKLQPNHGNAKLNLAMALVSEKNYAAALPYLIEAATNNPQHTEIQGHLAEAYLDLGKSEQAIAQYTKALLLDPNRADWHHNLAVLYLREKENFLAKQHFTISLNIQPNNPTAQHMLNALTQEAASANPPAEYVSDLFDQYSSYYTQHIKEKLNYKVPELLRHAVNKDINEFSKIINILDLGCGTGLCGVYFRDLADFMFGIDLSAGMLAQAKALGAYDGLCRGNILQAIPGQNMAVFDLVLAADVLVYIGDLQQLFAMICTALKNNGKFAFTIENTQQEDDFILQTSGRYAHNTKYIQRLSAEFNFAIETADNIILREQESQPIYGTLYLLARN